MKKLLNISMLVAIMSLSSFALQAQKYGHINSANILVQMPEVADLDQQLVSFQDSLTAIGQEMANTLKSDFDAFMAEYNLGNVPPIKAQEKQTEFQQREQQLIQLEQVIPRQVNEKRQQLLQPLLVKVQEAIAAVGKEGSFTMIFENGASASGLNALLFAPDQEDITALVKAKLGIN